MRFTFVVPGLASLEAGLAASSRPLARLASWSQARSEPRGLAAAILAAFGAPATDDAHDVPVAPLAMLGAGVDPHGAFVLAADPVALVAGRDDVAVAARVDDMYAVEASAIVDALNAHFAPDGVRFAAPRPDSWFALVDKRPDLSTVPIDTALGAMMSELAPAGADARTWQRWATEIQMLLHAHPINRRRESQGRSTATACGSRAAARWRTSGCSRRSTFTRPRDALGDSCGASRDTQGGEAMMLPARSTRRSKPRRRRGPASHVAVVLPAVSDAASLDALERAWLGPALAWLARGRIASGLARHRRRARVHLERAASVPGGACARRDRAAALRADAMMPAIVRRAVPAAAAALVASGIDPLLARLYASRGIREAGELDHSLGGLPPPSLMKGIDAAAQRLVHAIDARERIVIVADYDADGATACAIGMRALRAMGADVRFLVPNRFEHGYGLTPEIVAIAHGMGARLVVTVDNGIASVDGVTAAAALGVDVLVTDHHLPGERLPSPALIVDPNQPGCGFPSKHIAGVGVMFYVLAATRALLRERGRDDAALPNLAALLDLVALGTVADVVRLDRTNRILVDQGLRASARAARTRRRRAVRGRGRDASHATATDLGFVAGRASTRRAGSPTCRSDPLPDDRRRARGVRARHELDRMNRERRAIEATIEEQALADLDALASGAADRASVCVHRATWHQGWSASSPRASRTASTGR
jgi:hypothetical protein